MPRAGAVLEKLETVRAKDYGDGLPNIVLKDLGPKVQQVRNQKALDEDIATKQDVSKAIVDIKQKVEANIFKVYIFREKGDG